MAACVKGVKGKHKRRYMLGCSQGTYRKEQVLPVRWVTGHVTVGGKKNKGNFKFKTGVFRQLEDRC
jgi:hypothetical protein